VGGLLKGDFGNSYKDNSPVVTQIMKRLPNTALLAFSGALFAVVFGVVVGIISAKKQYSIFDNVFMVVTLLGAAAPAFWCGLILVLVFSLNLGWFPSSGMGSGFFGVLRSLILPAITIGLHGAATTARTTRSTMLEIVRQDYIDTARAKGLKESTITRKHMLKNAWIPIITVVGLNFGVLLGGSVLTETVFSWPGVGRYVVEAIKTQDIPCVLGCVVTLAILFTVVNLLVDILYAFVDPRIKAQYKGKGGGK
ncbi:MAG: ABC transporter permease, partial [Lachnospiraceae bacterium]